MCKRFVSIWLPHFITDWFTISNPALKNVCFVVRVSSHGRMMVSEASPLAQKKGIYKGMVLADAKAIYPALVVVDDQPGLAERILKLLALWCIRFTPVSSVDLPDGLILDASGCSHLWGGDEAYLHEIKKRLQDRGYDVRLGMADTIGAAWALARYSKEKFLLKPGEHTSAILHLPSASLRLDDETNKRLYKLGLYQIKDLINLPRKSIQRRFGNALIKRLHQALGTEEEWIEPVRPVEPFTERLNSFEPITTATGIEMALKTLLETICRKLKAEQKGLRSAVFKGYQLDGGIAQIVIETSGPSSNEGHLFKLFEIKLPMMQPNEGIELFVLEAKRVETQVPHQEKIWEGAPSANDKEISELLDRIAMRTGAENIKRYLPSEHHLPEHSFRLAQSLNETATTQWKIDQPRPVLFLSVPEAIEVTAPIPDYPPMLFRYKGKLHTIKKADGPERIEQEWWNREGEHRDYYYVEDEEGKRYWLFRLGHYDEQKKPQWFVHGFFA